jgi:outer membrane autotransporter protein
VHPFFLASSGEAAVGFFLTERMRLSLSPHPQNSVISLSGLVSADSQTSLRGRLGFRAGLHFDWVSRAFEPYAKVSVVNEFLGGDRVSTNQTAFFPTLSGVGIQAAGGLTARLSDSIYIYGEYDYADSDKIRIPWAVDAGLRWQW